MSDEQNKELFHALHINISDYFSLLKADLMGVKDKLPDGGEEFMRVSALLLASTVAIFHFLIQKKDDDALWGTRRGTVAIAIFDVLMKNFETMARDGTVCYIRRSCLWIYLTLFISIFLELVEKKKLEISFPIPANEFRALAASLPEEWIALAYSYRGKSVIKIAQELKTEENSSPNVLH